MAVLLDSLNFIQHAPRRQAHRVAGEEPELHKIPSRHRSVLCRSEQTVRAEVGATRLEPAEGRSVPAPTGAPPDLELGVFSPRYETKPLRRVFTFLM